MLPGRMVLTYQCRQRGCISLPCWQCSEGSHAVQLVLLEDAAQLWLMSPGMGADGRTYQMFVLPLFHLVPLPFFL